MAGLDYDVAVIGSGSGGSVAALRLTEKGYRVRDRRLPRLRGHRPVPSRYGHPGLHIVDGSAVSANLGVNPSLTITAQAERAMAAMAAWANRGEPDPRPPLGAPYQRVAAVPPAHPAVPAGRTDRAARASVASRPRRAAGPWAAA